MPFDSLRRVIAARAQNDPKMRDIQIARIFEASRGALLALWGEQRAVYVTPLSFKEGVLKLETTSPAAKQQLVMDKAKIKNEINRRLGALIVRDLASISRGF